MTVLNEGRGRPPGSTGLTQDAAGNLGGRNCHRLTLAASPYTVFSLFNCRDAVGVETEGDHHV